jgi:hypothetical protein
MLRLVGEKGQDRVEAVLIAVLAFVIIIAIFALLLPYLVNIVWHALPG